MSPLRLRQYAATASVLAGLLSLVYAAIFINTWWPWLVPSGAVLVTASLAMRPTWSFLSFVSFLKGLLPAIASVGLTLLVAEALTRLTVSKNELGGYQPIEPHPDYLFMLKPGAVGDMTYTDDLGEQTYHSYTISSQGFRDRAFGPKKDGEYRILMLGDSFTFGKGVNDDETIPKVLERLFQERFDAADVSVINGGCSGYGPWQARGVLLERGFALGPEMVVLQTLTANDIGDTIFKTGGPPRANARLSNSHKLLLKHYYSNWFAWAEYELLQRSRLYRLLYVRTDSAFSLQRLLPRLRFVHQFAVPMLPYDEYNESWYIEINLKDWYPELTEGWKSFENDILAIRNDCAERGLTFFVYNVPSNVCFIEGAWEHAVQRSGRPNAYEHRKEIRVAEEFFRRAALPSLSIVEAIDAHPRKEALYYKFDGHFTSLGAQVVAERLYQLLAPQVARELAIRTMSNDQTVAFP